MSERARTSGLLRCVWSTPCWITRQSHHGITLPTRQGVMDSAHVAVVRGRSLSASAACGIHGRRLLTPSAIVTVGHCYAGFTCAREDYSRLESRHEQDTS